MHYCPGVGLTVSREFVHAVPTCFNYSSCCLLDSNTTVLLLALQSALEPLAKVESTTCTEPSASPYCWLLHVWIVQEDSATPVKVPSGRGRGRPRKNPVGRTPMTVKMNK